MSPEIVALLILLGGAAAAIVFTLAIIVVVDRSAGNPRSGNEGEKERETERS